MRLRSDSSGVLIMTVDYYSLLTNAVSGKGRAAREKIYQEAYSLITRSNLARDISSAHVIALEEAIGRIEEDITAERRREVNSAKVMSRLLSGGVNWRRLAVGACAVIAIVTLSVLLYEYVVTNGPQLLGSGMTASLPKPQRGGEDVIMADLKPGVDGGSSGADLPFSLQRQVVFYRTTVVLGSIVIDRENRFLYLIDSNNSARRYGIGIAQECLKEIG